MTAAARAPFLLLLLAVTANAGEAGKLDPMYPFRTDWANAGLPWYQPKTGEFPPHHSDRRIGGELVAADYIHRAGRFRMGNGTLVDFTMPPYGTVYYHNAEADLRDVPLGTFFLFFLNQDPRGEFSLLATMQDEYSMLANHGFTWRVEELALAEGRLRVTKQKLAENKPDEGHGELLVDAQTRVWKGDQQLKLADLAVGDALLVSLGASTPKGPRRCTDLYVGAGTHQAVSDRQRKAHTAFLRQRGVPAWIDQIDGRKLTVTLIACEPAVLRGVFKDEGIDPELWAKEHRRISVVVANEHLRSYWPPVTNRGAHVLSVQTIPADCYGSSGMRWVIEVDSLLEGFRVGRNLRLFVHPSWPVKDMPFGEGLHQGGHDFEEPPEAREEDAADYPYRTDFGNPRLPWYRLQPTRFPPEHSAHQVSADLIRVGADQRSGQLRLEQGGEVVAFTMPPNGTVKRLHAEAELADLPLGTRCQVLLHPDAQGAFTVASVIMDEYTWLAENTITWKVEAVLPADGRLLVARDAAPVPVDYQLEPHVPPFLGRALLAIDAQTRVWKGDRQVALQDLAVGDALLVNQTGGSASALPRCTDLWIGAQTHQQVTEKQRAAFSAKRRQDGLPGWVESVDGRKATMVFFAAYRADFAATLGGDPWGKGVRWLIADDHLAPTGAAPAKAGFANHLPEGDTFGSYGCSGIRWVIETAQPDACKPGQILRIFKEDWPLPAEAAPAPTK